MPVQDTSGATSNVLRARGMLIDNANEQRMALRQAAGGIGASIGASVQSSKDEAIKAQMRDALTKAGLDPTIADAGPRAAALALMQEHQRKAQRQDVGIQKELDRGYEEGREREQAAATATALGLPSTTPAGAAPILFRQKEDEAERAREIARNKAFAPLVAPGKTLAPGGLLNFQDTPATAGLISRRFSQDTSGALGPSDLQRALGAAVDPPAPPKVPAWKDTREGITFQTDEDIRKALATQGSKAPDPDSDVKRQILEARLLKLKERNIEIPYSLKERAELAKTALSSALLTKDREAASAAYEKVIGEIEALEGRGGAPAQGGSGLDPALFRIPENMRERYNALPESEKAKVREKLGIR